MLAKEIEEGVPGWRGAVAEDELSLQQLAEDWLGSLFFRVFSPVQSVKPLLPTRPLSMHPHPEPERKTCMVKVCVDF